MLFNNYMMFNDITSLINLLTIYQLEKLLMLKKNLEVVPIEGRFQLFIKLVGKLIYLVIIINLFKFKQHYDCNIIENNM
jgi:hypothetical protein